MSTEDSIVASAFFLAIGAAVVWSVHSMIKQTRRKRASQSDAGKLGSQSQVGRAVQLKRYPLTVALIAICVAISVMSNMGASRQMLKPLYITALGDQGLSEIRAGEIWRLITPVFLHFGPLHLLFNMMWLWDLGRLLEQRRGTWFLGGFVLAVGIVSNLVQYGLTGFPFFGGMSGVVYGFLGYTWMQGRHNPRFGFVLHKQTVVTMLGWFVLCWAGLLGPIANWAHTTGLCAGVFWGYLTRVEKLQRPSPV
ncbi:MAG: rhomboid family intramembrane serine protease [Sulfuricaulis sp.]